MLEPKPSWWFHKNLRQKGSDENTVAQQSDSWQGIERSQLEAPFQNVTSELYSAAVRISHLRSHNVAPRCLAFEEGKILPISHGQQLLQSWIRMNNSSSDADTIDAHLDQRN